MCDPGVVSGRARCPGVPYGTCQGEEYNKLDEGVEEHLQNRYLSEQDDVEMREVVCDEGYGEEEQCEYDHPQVGSETLSDDKENSHDEKNE